MKLGFEESQSSYSSGSQSARAWTEAWVSAQAYCPHCGTAKISQFPNNSPLADFFCTSCNEEFELKSQKGKFGTRVVDGAFKTKCERLAASNNPNLFLMNYDLGSLAVVNLFIVPKHFFVREIIEERKPLAATARRAGWIGSNILLSRMAWFLNFYRCARCRKIWTDQWSCTCDDDCPHCGARHMSPFDSENLTELIEQDGKEFVAIRSPDTAEHDPDYRDLGRFPSREKAEEFLASIDAT